MSALKIFSKFSSNGSFFSCLAILTAVALVYGHTASFDLTLFDDNLLVSNALYDSVRNIPSLFLTDVFNNGSRFYRPVLNISFMADYLLNAPGYFAFHFTNIALHALSCILVYFFLLKNNFKNDIACPMAVLFAVHPAFSQAVAWLPGRNDTLLTCLVISSLLCFHEYIECNSEDVKSSSFMKNKKTLFLLAHVFFFLLALFTKETAVILPLAVFLYYFFLADELPVNKKENAAISVKSCFLSIFASARLFAKKYKTLLLLYLLSFAIYFALRVLSGTASADLDYIETIKGLFLIPVFFFKAFFSPNLTVYKRWAYFSLPALIAFFILFYICLRLTVSKQKGKYVFGILSAFLFLAVTFAKTKGIFPFFMMHRFYLPSVFLLFSLSSFVYGPMFRKVNFPVFAFLLAFFLASWSFVQCSYFNNQLSYWERACIEMPNDFTAQAFSAMNHYEKNMISMAVKRAVKALAIKPEHEDMNMILGIAELKKGNIAAGLDYMRKEINNNPENKTALALANTLENLVSQGITNAKIHFQYDMARKNIKK